MLNKKLTRISALVLAMIFVCASLVACGGNKEDEVAKEYTYRDYTSLSPSNWNELTYQDSNDTQIMNYIGSNFYSFNFKFDDKGEIVPGEFEMEFSAATALEDYSSKVDAKWGIPEGATARAYKITLRNDLKWQDGTPIKAEDFVYTMQQQLDPLFKNYRADSFYVGATVITNAMNYAKQGELSWEAAADVYPEYKSDLDSKLYFFMGPTSDTQGAQAAFRSIFGFPNSYDAAATAAYLIGYFGFETFTPEVAASMEGKTFAEIKADPTMNEAWNELISAWQTEPNEELHFFTTEYQFPVVEFSDVGIYAESDYELVIVLDKSLELLKEDGSLSYQAAYNMASLPLVHKAMYESCKIAPSEGSTLWTSKYNSSAETTMSWGPYKLESFQAGKQYTLVKNENWFGYGTEQYKDQYQTTRIVCDTIGEWNSAWLAFQAGNLDGISIDVTIAQDYKNSKQAYFTPSDFVSSIQLQSNKEQLKARETEGVNKTILSYTDFRKALSLSIDRAAYANECTTSDLAGFGLFNSMHYYDPENGGVFRNSDEAKRALCNVYAVDITKYDSLDDAVDSITGYNLEEARKLLTKAYNEALANGDIKETDKVVLVFGSGSVNETTQRRVKFLENSFIELAKGTPLEGRISCGEPQDFGAAWANDFRAGAYDICMGGWSGAAWDPGYFLLAYLGDSYRYAKGWDPSAVSMTFTMVGVGENDTDITETMTLPEWYDCLNGASGAKYDWSATALPQSKRLQLIAALEEQVLITYYAVPITNSFSASLISYKVDYITYEYNTFMAYGGVRYMTYNYDDVAWAAEVAAQNGQLNYK